MLKRTVLLILRREGTMLAARSVAMLIEGASVEAVQLTLKELEAEGQVMGLRSIDNSDIRYGVI